MLDEPAAIRDREREHFHACAECRNRYATIVADADKVGQWIAVSAVGVDSSAALARLENRIESEGLRPRRWKAPLLYRRQSGPRMRAGFGGAVAALVIAGAFTWTPAGSLAQDLITVFQPSHVVALPVTAGDLKTLSQLAKYGTVRVPSGVSPTSVSGPEAASAQSGMAVLTPASLPSDVSSTVTYRVLPSESASFTFSASKAAATAAASGRSLPSMPANIDGSTLKLTTGTAVLATYGAAHQEIPNLVIGQMRRPVVTARGVSEKELEDYLLSLPGISPELAAQVRAIGDPTTALPIPVPVNMAYSHPVVVHGVQGLAIGDSTGAGSGVVWQKDGVIYGVAGPISEAEVLTIANGLH
jgi:hypothetical protein